MSGHGLSARRYAERMTLAVDATRAAGLDALLIGRGAELEWLVGYAAQGHERLNLLVVDAEAGVRFVGPRLELGAAQAAPGLASGEVELISWQEDEDPFALVSDALASRSASLRLAVSDGLRADFLLGLQAACRGASFGLASTVLGPLREAKDADEIELLREAALAADRAVVAVSHGRLVGRSEADIAREVRDRLVDEGHDTAEFAIVACGPDSASPHHQPGDRTVSAGEALLFDIGGRRWGYSSDTTRTYWVGGDDAVPPDDDFAAIHGLVERAAAAAREAVRPGLPLEALDEVARTIISDAGHGEQFFHRLGHGIGIEVHEGPYVVAGNRAALVEGNAFSIEPGVYVEGRHGVRIEDIVVCTGSGGEVLNRSPRGLEVVRGS